MQRREHTSEFLLGTEKTTVIALSGGKMSEEFFTISTSILTALSISVEARLRILARNELDVGSGLLPDGRDGG